MSYKFMFFRNKVFSTDSTNFSAARESSPLKKNVIKTHVYFFALNQESSPKWK